VTTTYTLDGPMMQTDLPLPGRRQGKVRDVYRCTANTAEGQRDAVALVASDRISAFDVVMPNGPAGKGIVLTQISRFWFEMVGREIGDRVATHVLSFNAGDIDGLDSGHADAIAGRVTLGRPTRVVPIECVVRGYLTGSGWKEYRRGGAVCGIDLPGGLRRCEKLPAPIFTPATKAEVGHDENIDFDRACAIAGGPLMETLRDLSVRIYQMAHDYAAERGIIVADTKFEFGLPLDGDARGVDSTLASSDDVPILIDEVLTPDSSRFWPAEHYEIGRDQDSFDKQYVRNYLQQLVDAGQWDKQPPGPTLPDEVLRNTTAKYLDAYRALTGEPLEIKLK